jgi:hypothetical protein
MVHARGEPETHIRPTISRFLVNHAWRVLSQSWPTSVLWVAAAYNLDGICGDLINSVAKDLSLHVNRGNSIILSCLVSLLRDSESACKKLSGFRETAQVLLDLLQTVSLDLRLTIPGSKKLFSFWIMTLSWRFESPSFQLYGDSRVHADSISPASHSQGQYTLGRTQSFVDVWVMFTKG